MIKIIVIRYTDIYNIHLKFKYYVIRMSGFSIHKPNKYDHRI